MSNKTNMKMKLKSNDWFCRVGLTDDQLKEVIEIFEQNGAVPSSYSMKAMRSAYAIIFLPDGKRGHLMYLTEMHSNVSLRGEQVFLPRDGQAPVPVDDTEVKALRALVASIQSQIADVMETIGK